MKYTRYDLKRNKQGNSLLVFVLLSVLILAFLLGSAFSDFFMKNLNNEKTSDKPASVSQIDKTNSISDKFIVIQGGKFLKQENLERVKTVLSSYGNPFSIEEQGGTRLLLGIYKEEESVKVIKQLSDKNIDNSKITFTLQTNNDLCNQEIAALINAELDVINKLSDKSIKSIQTDELKKWVADLQVVNAQSPNIAALNELKAKISSLPKDLTNEKVAEIDIYLYGLLKKLSNK